MNFADVLGLLIGMGALVSIFGILGAAYRRRLEHKERIAEIKASTGLPASPSADHEETVERLEHRIRVLERIATDKTAKLSAQIEDLRSPAN